LPSADPAASSDDVVVSVVVPTKDRPGPLAECLGALAAQTLGNRLEVVVVDDASRAFDDVAAAVARYPRMRLVRGPGRGPAAARNAGARTADGGYLCFTDDDCVPAPDWAERLVEALRGGADAAAGMTLSGGGALRDAGEVTAHAPAAAPAPPNSDISFAPSNNLACTRSAFEATPFDESFPTAAGEDRDWCARLTAAGYALRTAPAAVLVHRPDLTFYRFARQQFRYGEGAFRHRRRAAERQGLEGIDFYLSLLRTGFRHGVTVGALVAGAQLITAAGFATAALRSRREAAAVTAGARPRP
jgi:GT2 family glycosyltransferase